MTSVVVCGPPRSGTSMMAQVLAASGLNGALDPMPPSPSNPHGFEEDLRVNRLNDELLAQLPRERSAVELPRRLWWLDAFSRAASPGMTFDRTGASRTIPPSPFVMKDPRFSFTYPAWRSVLGDCVEIVMIRSPAEIATSVASMVEREPAYFDAFVGRSDAIGATIGALWSASCRASLDWASESTYFLRNDEVGDRSVLAGLSAVVGTPLESSAVDPGLHRSLPGATCVPVDPVVAARVASRLAHDRNRLASRVRARCTAR